MYSGPSFKKLSEIWGPDKAKKIREVITCKDKLSDYYFFHSSDNPFFNRYPDTFKMVSSCFNMPSDPEIRMCMINEILDGYGEEAFSEETWGNFRYPHYSYVNMGDTYTMTILFNHETEKFILASWGDIAEKFNKGE